MMQVIRHEGLNEVIAVIVAGLHAQIEFLTGLCCGGCEFFRQQLCGQILIGAALINEDGSGVRPARHQFGGIVLAPGLGIEDPGSW